MWQPPINGMTVATAFPSSDAPATMPLADGSLAPPIVSQPPVAMNTRPSGRARANTLPSSWAPPKVSQPGDTDYTPAFAGPSSPLSPTFGRGAAPYTIPTKPRRSSRPPMPNRLTSPLTSPALRPKSSITPPSVTPTTLDAPLLPTAPSPPIQLPASAMAKAVSGGTNATASPPTNSPSPAPPPAPILLLPIAPPPKVKNAQKTPEQIQAEKDDKLEKIDFADVTVTTLKELLRGRDMSTLGKKDQLIERLMEERERMRRRRRADSGGSDKAPGGGMVGDGLGVGGGGLVGTSLGANGEQTYPLAHTPTPPISPAVRTEAIMTTMAQGAGGMPFADQHTMMTSRDVYSIPRQVSPLVSPPISPPAVGGMGLMGAHSARGTLVARTSVMGRPRAASDSRAVRPRVDDILYGPWQGPGGRGHSLSFSGGEVPSVGMQMGHQMQFMGQAQQQGGMMGGGDGRGGIGMVGGAGQGNVQIQQPQPQPAPLQQGIGVGGLVGAMDESVDI
ncbi:hypothetical protein HDV00_000798 [Rhizophlyctis rosea]|nr:hypothetical protein HDV00_000798 [Rhizophlyctis rosea]